MLFARSAGRESAHGFTLLEVMITVAIVAILAAIAIPNYSDYVTRGKIVDATTKLGDIRTQAEKYFFNNRTYLNGAACGIDTAAGGNVITSYNTDASRNFNFACVANAGPPEAYTLTATGIAARGMNNFVYTVDQANAKTTVKLPAGWAGTGNTCWVIKKDGSC
jgi:type IV pilus assembly protein PilE